MRGTWISYSEEELAWIESWSELPRALLHKAFVYFFNRPDVSQNALKQLCLRKGWKTGRTGCFVKGQVSHNKGRKGWHAPGCEKGWFKNGGLPHNIKGPGHEYVDTGGYVVLIVDEPHPSKPTQMTRPVHKHRWLWEQANGPVPEGHRLKCLDGNKLNTDPSNWEAIPMGLAPRLNGRFGRGYDTAPAELKPTIMAVAKLEHAAREKRRAKGKRGNAG